MLPELRAVFESLSGWWDHGPPMGRYWSGARIIELRDPTTNKFWAKRADDAMWGRIILRSAQSPGGLEAATANAAWLDECGQDAFTLEDFEAVQRRLSLSEGRILGTTTLYNVGWLKSEIYDPWREGDKDIEIVNFPSYINPAFTYREFKRMEAKLPRWRFAMFYRGLFARPAGLIYGAFRDHMLVDPFPIPTWWPRYVGVDFGGANTAIIWAALDPTNNIFYIYAEWLGGGLTSNEYAEKAREGLFGAEDWNAWGGAKGETQERRDWKAGGFKIQEPTISSVEPGITNVIGYLKGGRVRIFRNLKGLRDELGSYRRKLDEAGDPTEDIVNKRSFHRLDAVRYLFTGATSPTGKKGAGSMRHS